MSRQQMRIKYLHSPPAHILFNKTSQNVTITNNKGGDIDTGVNLTTLPYILVFAGVIVIAGAAFITRRRKYED